MAQYPEDDAPFRQSKDFDQGEVEPVEASTFFTRWGWPLFGAIAFGVFEMTASLSWSALVFALRFGWTHAYSGWFLWKSDPITKRGIALGLMHMAIGMSRIFWISLVIMLTSLAFIYDDPRGDFSAVAQKMSMVQGVVTVTGFTLAIIGCSIAWIGQIRLWVDPASYRSATLSLWPPTNSRRNRCRAIWSTVIVVATLVSIVLAVGLAILIFDFFPRGKLVGVLAFGTALLLVGVIAFLSWLLEQAKLRACADSPSECWPELENPQPMENSQVMGPQDISLETGND